MPHDIEVRLERIEARLRRLEERPLPRLRRPRHVDPKFPQILRRSMREKGLSQSDLARLMFGPTTNSRGNADAKGKDRISVWCAGKNRPSDKHLAKLAQFVDIV